MVRDARKNLDPGEQSWDAPANDNFKTLLDRPLPIAYWTGNETNLAATFPANQHENSLIWVNHTVYGYVIYHSDGTTWRPWKSAAVQVNRSITGTATVGEEEDVLLAGGTGTYTVTLPTAAAFGRKRRLHVKDSSLGVATITLSPAAGNIDGAATYALPASRGVTLVSDGTNYWVIL